MIDGSKSARMMRDVSARNEKVIFHIIINKKTTTKIPGNLPEKDPAATCMLFLPTGIFVFVSALTAVIITTKNSKF